MIYNGAIVLLGPFVLGAVLLTWWVLLLLANVWFDGGVFTLLLATAALVGLFWVNRLTRGDARTAVRVDTPEGPRKLAIPTLAGMTWLHDLTGRQEGPLVLRTAAGLVLFAPRLCEMLWTMGVTARRLWTLDLDRAAPAVGAVLRADGKALFRELIEAFPDRDPQKVVDDLALIDGILFLPRATPPGVTASVAMQREFAEWRENWKADRAAEQSADLYD